MKKVVLLPLVLLIVLISACNKEDSNPLESNDANSSTSLSGQPMPDFTNDPDYNGVLATINYEMASPMPGLPAISTNIAFATLGDGTDAGAVAVNSNTLGKMTNSGKTYYIVPNPTNPTQVLSNISFNGTAHSWAVAGANGIPSFNGSVNSPSNFNLTAPQQNASVSKAGDFVIRWSGGTSARVHVQITSLSNSSIMKYKSELNDNGSYTFPASEISGFSGDCLVHVVKYNYTTVNSGGKKYYLISEIVKNVTVKIN